MERAIPHLSFADWVLFVFDHPAESPQWYWGEEAPFWNAPVGASGEGNAFPFRTTFPAPKGRRS
jgi:hypothetical protein